jgi:hypothetical protein
LYINNPILDLDAEHHLMEKANSIKKSDRISHYHPLHLNYLTPKQFSKLLRSVSFEAVGAFIHHTNADVGSFSHSAINRSLKDAAHYAIGAMGLSFRRQLIVVRAVQEIRQKKVVVWLKVFDIILVSEGLGIKLNNFNGLNTAVSKTEQLYGESID